MDYAATLDAFVETLPTDEFYVKIPAHIREALDALGCADMDATNKEARDALHVWGIARALPKG